MHVSDKRNVAGKIGKHKIECTNAKRSFNVNMAAIFV